MLTNDQIQDELRTACNAPAGTLKALDAHYFEFSDENECHAVHFEVTAAHRELSIEDFRARVVARAAAAFRPD